MDNYYSFRTWLDTNTDYCNKTKSNILSRLKRANTILPIRNEPVYLFYISQEPEFERLTKSVKSQIRQAIKLYFEFLKFGDVR